MKINKKYVAGSVAVLALSVCSYELGRYQAGQAKKESNRVAYIDGDQAGQKAENLTPDEVSKREGINAEQIVIKITDQGYVTSHGDHYHYYNGKVPYDAIISEELLMKDPNYQLKDSDIVNEIKGGYVIKVDGKYYVYLKDAAHADNIRTKKRLNVRSKNTVIIIIQVQIMLLLQPELKDAIQRMTVISSTHLILLRTRVMLILSLTAITSTIFLRVICLPVN